MPLRIVLADDHPVVRDGLKGLLSEEPDFDVVGETGDGLAVPDLVEDLEPDVLVLDVLMPGAYGLEVLRQVTKRHPKTRVLILSMYANESYVLEAMRNGAAGYALKSSPPDELVRAVRSVGVGNSFLSPLLNQRMRGEEVPEDPLDSLTPRERQVLHLIAEGNTNAAVAERLFISSRTVESHRASVMNKLALASHAELIRYAIRRGIVDVDQ